MKFTRFFALLAGLLLALAAPLAAQTTYLVNDTFSDTDRIGGTDGSETTSAAPEIFTPTATNTQWVVNRASQLVASATGMNWTFDVTSNTLAAGRFPDVAIGADPVTFRLSFTTGALGGTTNNLRMALVNGTASGFRLTDGFGASDASYVGDIGYGIFSSGSTVAGPSTSNLVLNMVKRATITSNDLLGTAGVWSSTIAGTTGSTGYIQPNTTYVLEITASYNGSTLTLTTTLTGGNLAGHTVTINDSTDPVTTFNLFAMRWGGGSGQLTGLRFNSFTVTVPAAVVTPPAITSQPASVSATAGDNVSFTVAATGDAPLAYQWRRNDADLTDGGNISGATTATLSLTGVQIAQAGSYTVEVSNAGGSVTSDAASLTVAAAPEPPTISAHPQPATIDQGGNISFSVTASGTSPLSYQWRKDGVDLVDATGHIAGATTATLSLTGALPADSGNYTVFISNVAGNATSNAAALTVVPPTAPQITADPAGLTVNVGDPVTFSVTATGTAPLAYQWRKDGVDIPGATAASYSIALAQLDDAATYTVFVSNVAGSATSAGAVLTVNAPTSAPAAPVATAATGIVKSGFTANWNASAGAIGYWLDVSTSPDFTVYAAGYENRDVGNVTSFAVAGLSSDTTYYYRVRADNGLLSANSNVITATTASADGLVILHDRFTATGANAGLVVDANGFLAPTSTQGVYAPFGTANFSYSNGIDATTGLPNPPAYLGVSASSSGRGIMTYFQPSTSTTSIAVGEALRATVTLRFVDGSIVDAAGNLRWGFLNSGGNGTPYNLNQLPARFAHNASNSLTSSTGSNITGRSARGYSGYLVSTRANTTGSVDTIGFWKRMAATVDSGVNDTTSQILGPTANDLVSTSAFSPIGTYGGGQNGPLLNGTGVAGSQDYVATLTVSRVSETQVDLSYRVTLNGATVMAHTASQTSGDLVTSFDSLMLFSLYGPSPRFTDMLIEKVISMPQILTQPASQAAVAGETRVLSVAAAGVGPLTYQWKKDNVNVVDGPGIAGAQTATLTLSNLQAASAGDYTVTVTNSSGSVVSSVASVTVSGIATAPSITAQPQAQTVDQGDNVSFTVQASGTSPLTYQWRRNGADVANVSGRISGATSATLSITGAQASDAGTYTVLVSNSAGTALSDGALLTVIVPEPPQITTAPASQSVLLGASVTFNVTATGTAPLAYQWKFNGTDIAGATGTSYTIPQAQLANDGSYTVVVTNIAGSVTSPAAVLTVNLPTEPPGTPTATAATAIEDTAFTANWNGVTGAAGYRLDVSTSSNFSSFVTGFQNRDVGTSLSRRVTGLTPNTTYYFRVRAYNDAGASANSNVITAATTPTLVPATLAPDLSAMAWFKTRSANSIITDAAAKTVTFDSGIGTSAVTIVGYLPSAVDLAIGQTLTMTLNFRTGSFVEQVNNNSFRLALFNSAGTRISANSNSGDSNAAFADDRGYLFNYNFNGSAASLHGRRASVEFADNNLLGTTTDLWSASFIDAARTAGTNAAFSPNTNYTLTVTITRFADRTTVTSLMHGGNIASYFVSGDDTSSGSLVNGSYDQFGMRINASSAAINTLTFTSMNFSVEAYREPTPPAIVTHAPSTAIFSGQSVTFTVAAQGTGPFTYQWFKNGVAISDGGRFAGAGTATLTITGATLADAGTYTAVVTSALGADVSDPAVLTVTAATAPSITTPPATQTVNEGASVTFNVVATGTSPLSYSWTRNGTPLTDGPRITGTATATLTLVAASPDEAGTYAVTVTNVAGNASASATLNVTAATTVPPAPVATAATGVTNVQFTANWNAAPSATSYQLDIATNQDFSNSISVNVTARSYLVTGLTDGTTYYYRVRALNSVGFSGYSATIATLAQLNEPPVITSQNNTVFTAGVASNFRVLVGGSPAPTVTATGLPSWATLAMTEGAWRLAGTAPAGTSGNFTFTITAANGNPPNATQSFTLTVSPIPSITAALSVTTLAGTAGTAGTADATGAAARFRFPLGVAADSTGAIYIADTDNHTVRKVTSAGVVTTLAGTAGSSGTADGTGAAARFNKPASVAVDASGNVYVADTLNHTIRKVTSTGVVTTIAGTAGVAGAVNGIGAAASFNGPQGVALNADGTVLFVADTNNHTIRRIALDTNTVTTFAGSAGVAGTANGTGTAARFRAPTGLAVAANGTVYVADMDNHTVRAITSAGAVTTLAGHPEAKAAADGTAGAARFSGPAALALGSGGTNLYVVDSDNHTIRRIVVSSGAVTTSAGLAGTSGTADGAGSTARFKGPSGIALVNATTLAIVDTENHTVRSATLPVAITITAQPQSVVVPAGGSASFSVTATGLPAPTYQWFLNGTALQGATSPTYSVSNVSAQQHGGNYTVVVSNTLGSVTSSAASLTIPVSAADTSTGGGGGGAPSTWFLGALALLAAARGLLRRKAE